MITCKRCGRPAPMGMANCQYCGMSLMDAANEGSGMTSSQASQAAASNQHQPELPAWLETLRTSERPAASTSETANFSTGGLVDEGMLPSWMRPERAGATDNTPSDAHPARRPASTPAPNTDGGFLPTRGMSASSLIDEQALPVWLQEKQAASQHTPQENISAASLMQPEVLPDWMKKAQPQPPAPAGPKHLQYAQPVIPPEGIKGNDLIDQQALPPWLSGQDSPPLSAGPEGLAASSLLDANALPPWLREANPAANQEQIRGSASAFAPLGQPGQTPAGQGQVPYHQMASEQAPNMNSNLSAASFIDMNSLPDWLRPAEDQRPNAVSSSLQPGPGVANNPRQAAFGVPPRPDNMRVPSRPRGEIGSHEESEVAANVFSSMLGVASVSPYFPGQQPRDASGHAQVSPRQHLPQPQADYRADMPSGPGSMPGTFGTNNIQPGPAGVPSNQGYAQAPGPGGYQNAYSMGSMPGGMPPQQSTLANGAGMQPGTSPNNGEGQSKPNSKPAKRGFLSTILEWFSFSR